MSEQYGPAREPLPQEQARRLKLRRNKIEELAASDFRRGDRFVAEYRVVSGRIVRLLCEVEDVYEHATLGEWKARVCMFARVAGVEDADQIGLTQHIVKVSFERGGLGWWARSVRYTQHEPGEFKWR